MIPTEFVYRDVCQLEENLTPSFLSLFPLLVPSLMRSVHHAQHDIFKLPLHHRSAPLALECICHLLHGAQTSGNIVIDQRQKSSPLPHRRHLLIEQDDVVVLIELHPTQQKLHK